MKRETIKKFNHFLGMQLFYGTQVAWVAMTEYLLTKAGVGWSGEADTSGYECRICQPTPSHTCSHQHVLGHGNQCNLRDHHCTMQ